MFRQNLKPRSTKVFLKNKINDQTKILKKIKDENEIVNNVLK